MKRGGSILGTGQGTRRDGASPCARIAVQFRVQAIHTISPLRRLPLSTILPSLSRDSIASRMSGSAAARSASAAFSSSSVGIFWFLLLKNRVAELRHDENRSTAPVMAKFLLLFHPQSLAARRFFSTGAVLRYAPHRETLVSVMGTGAALESRSGMKSPRRRPESLSIVADFPPVPIGPCSRSRFRLLSRSSHGGLLCRRAGTRQRREMSSAW